MIEILMSACPIETFKLNFYCYQLELNQMLGWKISKVGKHQLIHNPFSPDDLDLLSLSFIADRCGHGSSVEKNWITVDNLCI